MRRSSPFVFAALLGLPACDLGRDAAYDAAPGDAAWPPLRTDLVPAVGSDTTFDIACWNIENFPASPSTPRIVADLIASMQLDVVVAIEIVDTVAWAELVARLGDYDAALSSHVYATGGYQKLGVLWRRDVVSAGTFDELFQTESSAFPRPAIGLPVTYDDDVSAPLSLELLGVHLKAGTDTSDIDRRAEAMVLLDDHVQAQIADGGEDRVVILGDYNTVLGGAKGDQVMAPLQDLAGYDVLTAPLAAAGAVTFLPASIMLDHMTATAALGPSLAGSTTVVPPLDEQYPGYQAGVSDHLPVVLSLRLAAARIMRGRTAR